jgi:hypothetical protein
VWELIPVEAPEGIAVKPIIELAGITLFFLLTLVVPHYLKILRQKE